MHPLGLSFTSSSRSLARILFWCVVEQYIVLHLYGALFALLHPSPSLYTIAFHCTVSNPSVRPWWRNEWTIPIHSLIPSIPFNHQTRDLLNSWLFLLLLFPIFKKSINHFNNNNKGRQQVHV
jgi:hypothetical protein